MSFVYRTCRIDWLFQSAHRHYLGLIKVIIPVLRLTISSHFPINISPTMNEISDWDLRKEGLKAWDLAASHIHYPADEKEIITDFNSSVSDGTIWIWLVVVIISFVILRWLCILVVRCCCCCCCCGRRTGYQPIPPSPAKSLIPVFKMENRSRVQKSGTILPVSITPGAIPAHSTYQQKQAPPTPPHFASPISGISKVTEKRLAEKGVMPQPPVSVAKTSNWRR